jgi:hypothetical protein
MRSSIIAAAMIFVLLSRPLWAQATPADPWYADVDGHWAEESIRLLWEEEVTNGFQESDSLYMPDQSCTRAELAVLLAKVFRFSPVEGDACFPDVSPSYLICGCYPAYSWIQTAAKNGIVRGESDSLFHGDDTITREQSIAMLVRGLDLGPYMQRLTEDEIETALAVFTDWRTTSDCFRRELATATRLLILQGYPDRTSRPQGEVTRAEAATLIERACLVLGHSKPQVFSPDSDGVSDITILSITGLKNHNAVEWGLSVFDSTFAPLRSWVFWIGWNTPQPSVMQCIWDGKDSLAQSCAPGLYLFRGYIRDRQGQYHYGAYKPVEIEKPALYAWVYPVSLKPGETGDVIAAVEGIPTRVHIVGWKTDMTPSMDHWSSPLPVSITTPEGRYYLTVRAVFASGASRSTIVSYDVLNALDLTAWLSPPSVTPPATVLIYADSSESAEQVTVNLPFQPYSLAMSRETATHWRATASIPMTTRDGVFDFEVTAIAPSKRRTVHLQLTVIRFGREQLSSVLLS